MDKSYYNRIENVIQEATGVNSENIIISFTHTHSVPRFSKWRINMPGGNMIEPYIDQVCANIKAIAKKLLTGLREVYITYGIGKCLLAANRDLWDENSKSYICGYNPDKEADDTLIVGRVSNIHLNPIAVFVNYACHATTLAWQNRLFSPDYIGALRKTVEEFAAAQCIFVQGACGELGPKHGFVGDVKVAESNGRQLAYAVLSTLEGMGPAGQDYCFKEKVVSGANLAIWEYLPLTKERRAETQVFSGGKYSVRLPVKVRPEESAVAKDLEHWETKQGQAKQDEDEIEYRNCTAMVERTRRLMARLENWPEDKEFVYEYSIWRMGDAVWIHCNGEPYNLLQTKLRRAFPDKVLVVAPYSYKGHASYLPDKESYGRNLYQENIAIMTKGSLEVLIDEMILRIKQLT